MKISAYITMDTAILPDAAAQAARAAGGEWTIVCERNGRQLVSALAPPAMVMPLMSMLAPYHPTLIGVWDQDGQVYREPDAEGDMEQVYPLDIAPYLAVMPDNTDGSRPTEPRDLCGWAGWGERMFQ